MAMRQKTFRSGIAVTVSSLGVQFLGFITTIILARLLDPSDFGIMRLAAILLGSMNLFAGLGMGPALIASREDTVRAAYHSAATTFCGGLLLTALVFALAPTLAGFMEEDILTSIVRWMSIGVLAISLRIVPNAILEREMMFGRRIIPDMSATLARMVIAVGLALAGYGVWSLVIAWIVQRLVAFVVTVVVCPTMDWMKRQKWDRNIARGLWKFGFTQLRTGLVQYVYNNGDGLIVGKVLGTAPLGFYTQAQTLSNLPVRNISQVVNAVLLPAYAKIRDDKDRLAKAFLSCFQFVATLTIPIAAGLFILAPELVIFLIGEKWRGSIPVLQVFTLMAFLRPLSGSTSPLFLSLHKPEYNLRTAMIQGVSMFALIALFIRWGAPGVAAAVVSAFALGFCYNIYLACWRCGLQIRPRDIGAQVWSVVVSTVIMLAVVQLLKQPVLWLGGGDHNALTLIVLILAGMVAYVISLILLKRSLVINILELVSSSVGGKKLLKHPVLRKFARFLKGGKSAPSMKRGQPDDFPGEVLETAVKARGGGAVKGVRHQHMSGWKKRGAFRVVAEDEAGREWRFIYKNAYYGREEIAALEGLPVKPGPPEFTLYQCAGRDLRAFLPEVYASREVVPDEHYWYLMEDLSRDYTTRNGEDEIITVCDRLPEIHAALGESVDARLGEKMLRYDREFSERLLGYVDDIVRRFAGDRKTRGMGEWLPHWDLLTAAYAKMLDEVYENDVVIPIHGDLNMTNIMFHNQDPRQFKLIDWEWVGFGLPQSELASVLKVVPSELEFKALATYVAASGRDNAHAFERGYLWCKMQRGIFDAGFFARQITDASHGTLLNLDRHMQRALARARQALEDLERRAR
jgi:PST family polysaccharide transporter